MYEGWGVVSGTNQLSVFTMPRFLNISNNMRKWETARKETPQPREPRYILRVVSRIRNRLS